MRDYQLLKMAERMVLQVVMSLDSPSSLRVMIAMGCGDQLVELAKLTKHGVVLSLHVIVSEIKQIM